MDVIAEPDDLDVAAVQAQPLRHGQALTTILRVAVSIVALIVAALVLKPVFNDLDFAVVKDAITSLSAPQWMAFVAVFVATIGCNGLLTTAVVPGLPIRRGVAGYLGSSAVASHRRGQPPSTAFPAGSSTYHTPLALTVGVAGGRITGEAVQRPAVVRDLVALDRVLGRAEQGTVEAVPSGHLLGGVDGQRWPGIGAGVGAGR